MPTQVTDPDILAQLNAPVRADVPSSARIWGDKEAEAQGLYDRKPVSDPNLLAQLNGQPSRAPTRITVNPIKERFTEVPQVGGDALQQGLNQRGAELTRGEPISTAASMAIDAGNQLSAASQGTTPHIDSYKGKLLSTQTFEDDAGNILFRDPQTGKVNPTDKSKHVAIRDPNDNTVKVFARDAATDESPVVGVSRVLAPGLGAGAPTQRAMVGLPKVLASDFVSAASPHYKNAETALANIQIPGEYGRPIVDRIKTAISAAGQPGDIEAVKEVHSIVNRIAPEVKPLSQFDKLQSEMNGVPVPQRTPAPFTADKLKNIREELGLSISSPNPRTRAAARAAVAEIDSIIERISPTASNNLSTANSLNTTSHELASFDSMAGRAGTQESFKLFRGNVGERMRRYLGSVVDKADELLARKPNVSTKGKTGFTNDEIDAFREFMNARSGLRNVAEASPTKGLLRMGAEAAAAAHFGPAALAIPAIGLSASVLNKVLDARDLGKIRELIAKRSPQYAEAVKASVDRYTKAQTNFASDPSPNRLAAYVSASRALSAGLTKDGIDITSGALLKSIQGPMKSAAEGDEPAVPGRPGE